MPKLTQANMNAIRLVVPPVDEQQAIADILGTLDDKIELNRRMNETLEAMARALFKSWFVDFDAVRAKAGGRDPGLPEELAGLFPDRFVDSELGEIPEGWEVAALAQHVKVVKGVSYKGSGLSVDRGLPLHNLNSIREGGGYKHDGIKYYTGDYAPRHVVRPGDAIVANTEQGHDRLLIGFAALVPAMYGDRGLVSHHVYRVVPRDRSQLTTRFLVELFNSRRMHGVVSRYANGTTVNMLPPEGLQLPLFVCPPGGLIRAFDAFASAAAERFDITRVDSRRLAGIRDSLLPRLVSGELRVIHAESLQDTPP